MANICFFFGGAKKPYYPVGKNNLTSDIEDEHLCRCAAWNPSECLCGAWDDVPYYDDDDDDYNDEEELEDD
jgi:hypothetical protein